MAAEHSAANRYALAPMTTRQTWTGQLGIADDHHLAGLTRLADGLRETGTPSPSSSTTAAPLKAACGR